MNPRHLVCPSARQLYLFLNWLAFICVAGAAAATAPQEQSSTRRWLIRVDPVEIGPRTRDEMPAELELVLPDNSALDPTTFRVIRTDAAGDLVAVDGISSVNLALPFRWYDAAIPYDFPEFHESVSRTAGVLRPKPRERGGYYLNAMGDGRKGRLVWMHDQVGGRPSWYVVAAELRKPGTPPRHLPPRGWIGDGQARCAERATQSVHSDHLRIDVDDWDGDGDDDLYFPSTQGTCFVERSFLTHGYARGVIVCEPAR